MASLGVAGPMLLRGNPVAAAARSAAPFSAGTVDAIARKLSRSPFQAPDRSLPPALARLDYDHTRSIRFARKQAFRARSGGRFIADLMMRGWLARHHVEVFDVTGGMATAYHSCSDRFTFLPALKPVSRTGLA